jgi:hypothetical protein
VLPHYGDHPVIEPGELYLGITVGQDGASTPGSKSTWHRLGCPPANLARREQAGSHPG